MSFGKIRKQVDILMAFAVIGILVVLVIPIPPRVLDILLALNISISIVIN